jgi:hypothetical protein
MLNLVGVFFARSTFRPFLGSRSHVAASPAQATLHRMEPETYAQPRPLHFSADDEDQPLIVAAYTGAMANSGKVDRAQHKAAAQRNRVKDVKARAKNAAKKRRRARASKAKPVKTAPKTPPASS